MRSTNTIVAVLAIVLWAIADRVNAVTPPSPVVLDFDDIQVSPADSLQVSGTNYGGLVWGTSSAPGLNGNPGFWIIDDGSDDPLGQWLVNGWGAAELGIKFPSPVRVVSTSASAQGTANVSAPGIRIRGYRDGELTAVTPWFTNLVRHEPSTFSINLAQIDSIIVEAQSSADAVAAGQTWGAYRLDNFTYVSVPEPQSFVLASLSMLIPCWLRIRRRRFAERARSILARGSAGASPSQLS